jgi:hypothetical protein
MFWGCFAGGRKGTHVVWEKEYRGIGSSHYIQFIVPLIAELYHELQATAFQQDNATLRYFYRSEIVLPGGQVIRGDSKGDKRKHQ